jgi:acetyl-CoA synthetase
VLSLEIRESCNKKLAEYKWVRVVEFVEELPKTISGKTRRAQLRGAG